MLKKIWRGIFPISKPIADKPQADFNFPLAEAGDVEDLRSGPGLPMEPSDATVDWLRQQHPIQVNRVLADARKVVDHRFTLLGAIDFEPHDTERGEMWPGYQAIDWRLDPVSGLRFPTGFAHKTWNMDTMRPGLADIKLPWELARCQHWPLLGQAWRLSGELRFAEEIGYEMRDFVQSNPVGVGVNWVCTMDVAIRAANWAIALRTVRECDGLDEHFWKFACDNLLAHGHFIRNNLEDKYEVTSNHFLSNVVGLLYVAAVFADRPQGQAWLDWCIPKLEREVGVQILPDGADFESSIPYHRLVTELFLGAWVVCRHAGCPLSAALTVRLENMVDYLLGVMRPDGLMPQVGDADDGRLHILSGYGRWNPQDARHLFAPAAIALKRPDWADYAGPEAVWEAVWWGMDASALTSGNAAPPDHVHQYPQAGHMVSRKAGYYLLITNARVGTVGFGNHKHNDQLGFELHWHGQPLMVDAGSHVYTGNPVSRNHFRSTACHNTLTVDDTEQNEINPQWLFRMFEKAEAEHLAFEQLEHETVYRGRHVGYQRLTNPVVHERQFVHLLGDGSLSISDHLTGKGLHNLHWHFHLAPGVVATPIGNGEAIALDTPAGRCYIESGEGLFGTVTEAAYSPSYGVLVGCLAIDFRTEATIDGNCRWNFSIAANLSEQSKNI